MGSYSKASDSNMQKEPPQQFEVIAHNTESGNLGEGYHLHSSTFPSLRETVFGRYDNSQEEKLPMQKEGKKSPETASYPDISIL